VNTQHLPAIQRLRRMNAHAWRPRPRVLSQIHGIVQQLLDDAYAEIEGMIAGDVDETEDDE